MTLDDLQADPVDVDGLRERLAHARRLEDFALDVAQRLEGSTPAATVPARRCRWPLSRVCTYSADAGLLASFTGFGRRAATWAFHCATLTRYSNWPPRVAALRRSSRELVPGRG